MLRNGLLRYILYFFQELSGLEKWKKRIIPNKLLLGCPRINIFTQDVMKVVFPRFTFCSGETSNIFNDPIQLAKESKHESSNMSLDASAFKKKQNLMFFFRPSQQKSSFRHSETPIFLLESWPCHTKFMCMNIIAFQKSHKYHVSGCKTKNHPKKNRGTRKGAVSAGYLVLGSQQTNPKYPSIRASF